MKPAASSSDVDVFQFFKEEFTDADGASERIDAIHNIKFVASHLGPQRTRADLLPFLAELPTLIGEGTDDELLHAVASEYSSVADFIGGEERFHLLIPPLRQLAAQEESIVREKAVETLITLLERKCSTAYQPTFAKLHLLPAIEQLSKSDVFPARASACGLIPAVYRCLDPPKRAELLKMFCALCQDDMPMVRRAAANRLADVCAVCDKQVVLVDIIPTLHLCWKDPLQDLIRASAVTAAIQFAKRCTPEEFQRYIFPVIHGAAKDPSWRARVIMAQNMHELMASTTPNVIRTDLAPMFRDMIQQDSETEVQAAAIGSLNLCIQYLEVESIETLIYPTFAGVITGSSPSARAKLASSYGTLASKFGRQKTLNLLIPHILALMADEFREVRMEVTAQLSEVCQVLGPESSVEVLLDAMVNLMSDPQWRIRLTLVKQLPILASFFGKAFFSHSRWEELQLAALMDNIHAVREAAVQNVTALVSCFGKQWAVEILLPQLLDLYKKSNKAAEARETVTSQKSLTLLSRNGSQNNLILTDTVQRGGELPCRSVESYLSRITLLHALEKAALALPQLDSRAKLLSVFVKAGSDDIPNVRATSAIILANLVEDGNTPESILVDVIMPHLKSLAEKDTDVDVRYFAAQSQKRCHDAASSPQRRLVTSETMTTSS